ncbi:hypothetical protein F5Y19DRAFT_465852 [Xylariaceae sp. FL1651]|nr:hypothetical protein F5Y19DRAFT_465852 [Xylariaceae sp. FL1651]
MAPDHDHGYKQGLKPGSGPKEHLVPSLPATPTKILVNSGNFDIWFLEFSNQYCLNLRRPDPKLLIEQTKESPELLYYYRLKYHYHKGNVPAILQDFDRAAGEIHSKWVKKTRKESDVTPSFSDLPRATTEHERSTLLERLASILEDLSPTKPIRRSVVESESRSSLQDISTLDDPPSPSPFRSKRPSDESSAHTLSSKRSRGTSVDSHPSHVLSRLDSGKVRASIPLPDLQVPPQAQDPRFSQQEGLYKLPVSVNTSKSSFVSKVFSEPEDPSEFPATQETEVTVEASSQEKRRRPSPQLEVNSLAPSSATERALETLSNEHSNLQQNARNLLRRNGSASNSYSDFSHGSADLGLRQFDNFVPPNSGTSPTKFENPTTVAVEDFEKRLKAVWPTFPPHLQAAPLAVRWEIMRIALHCEASMEDLNFQYEPILNEQNRLWERLRRLNSFQGKSFPEKSRPEAWNAAKNGSFRSSDQVVLLTASLTLNTSKTGPLFKLRLHPLKLELPHRLDRRFGSDRFLEITIPSMYSQNMKKFSESALNKIHHWLVRGSHIIVARIWTSFYTKPVLPKKTHNDNLLKPEVVTVLQERVYLFAREGTDFVLPTVAQSVSSKHESSSSHTKMGRKQLLDWLLQIPQNKKQTFCKLFSRIALGLSRTHPTVVLQPEQILHQPKDILSPTGKVMNDGIGRMSTALARQIRDKMGLDNIPAGYQGRLGSAKGFWIRDTRDTSDDIWIETFPSQRKWECDYAEEDHRTFEVRSESKELKSATLNLQLLPILEDRAIDPLIMKEQVGNFMKNSLLRDIESQKDALQDPAHFKLWVHENVSPQRRQERARLGYVPWTAGLPISREDQMELLLSQGFNPTKLEFLRKIAFDMRKEKCEELQTKLNVKVGQSTYAYMVIDFLGVLNEDEVHLGFSSKFSDEQSGFSETFLHGMDVLVARTPAHYPSDIQRVKAVFKPELGSLKDVIIFPSKGNIPLADKLSGGDYDGDIAWVCWEPAIVNNFINAELPDVPDLFEKGVLTKITVTYQELALSGRGDVTSEFLDQAFRFNMEQSLLGSCTNYKEKLCYSRNSVRDEPAIFLSTLISHLVDRAKQGIVFSEQDWSKQRKVLNAQQGNSKRGKNRLEPPAPQYKNNDWGGNTLPTHIVDYVKFVIGKPTIERELRQLKEHLGEAQSYDKDLVRFYEFFEKFRRPLDERKKEEHAGRFRKNTWETVLDELAKDLDTMANEWADSREDFDLKLANTYEKWQKIMPTDKVNSKTVRSLCEDGLARVGLSQWDLLKASCCFKIYYKRFPALPWYIAGYQLAYLKSICVSQDRIAPPILMTPTMYAGVRPDARFVRAVAALDDGYRIKYTDGDFDDDEGLRDEDV